MDHKLTIGLTGASGVLGRILVSKMKERSIDVIPFRNDIRNLEEVSTWFTNYHFDILIHMAALVPVKTVNENPIQAFDVNVNGTLNLFKAIQQAGIRPYFFYASTSHVYKSSLSPLKEDSEISPVNLYGQTKYMGEKITEVSAAHLNLDYCIGRIFSFWHPTQAPAFLYPAMLSRLSSEDLSLPFKLMGANNVRDLSNAEEVVDRVIQLIEQKAKGVYNIASGKGIKIRDFVQSLTEQKLQIEDDVNEIADYLVADITRFKQIIQ